MEALADALEKLGLSVFFDARIPTGSVFDEVVDKELKSARAVVVCWTQGAVESRWVRSEALIGWEREILAAAFFEAVSLPAPYNIVQAEDLTKWHGDLSDPAFGKLLRRVGALVGRPQLEAEAKEIGAAAMWVEKDATDRSVFDAKMIDARRMFEISSRTRPVEFETRLSQIQQAFDAWLPARRARATPMPDPLIAVENDVEKLRAELITARRERDAAALALGKAAAVKPAQPAMKTEVVILPGVRDVEKLGASLQRAAVILVIAPIYSAIVKRPFVALTWICILILGPLATIFFALVNAPASEQGQAVADALANILSASGLGYRVFYANLYTAAVSFLLCRMGWVELVGRIEKPKPVEPSAP